jgi:NADH:ubiquinone oxidoreductase subunit E
VKGGSSRLVPGEAVTAPPGSFEPEPAGSAPTGSEAAVFDPAEFPGALGEEVRALVQRHGLGGTAVLPVLEAVARARGPISDLSFRLAGRALGIRPADLKELALRSGRFAIERRPAVSVVVCVHRHCRARGAAELLRVLGDEAGEAPGEGPRGGPLRVETARCLGACTLGPNVLVDGQPYYGVDPPALRRILEALSAAAVRPA